MCHPICSAEGDDPAAFKVTKEASSFRPIGRPRLGNMGSMGLLGLEKGAMSFGRLNGGGEFLARFERGNMSWG